MDIFMDLISTLSVVLPIFGIVLVLSIAIVLLVVSVWDRRKTKTEQGPVADWYDSYADPKERMDTLSRPAEAPRTAWIDELLDKYQLWLEVDSEAGVVRLHDRKFFELKRKTMNVSVSQVLGCDYQQARVLLRKARFNFNRRAKRQGIVPVKNRTAAVAA